MKYIAVATASRPSKRDSGGWECWVGATEKEAVEMATKKLDSWGHKDYIIRVGTLSSSVEWTPDCAFYWYRVVKDNENK